MNIPGRLTGTAAIASWLNALREVILSSRIMPGKGYKIKSQSASGTILEIESPPPSSTLPIWI